MTVAVKSHNGVTKYLCKICLFIKNYTRRDYVYWHKGLPFKESFRTTGRERERERKRFYLMVQSVAKIIEH